MLAVRRGQRSAEFIQFVQPPVLVIVNFATSGPSRLSRWTSMVPPALRWRRGHEFRRAVKEHFGEAAQESLTA